MLVHVIMSNTFPCLLGKKISLGNPNHHDEEWEVSHSNCELKKDVRPLLPSCWSSFMDTRNLSIKGAYEICQINHKLSMV
jgi:hypothetical protein